MFISNGLFRLFRNARARLPHLSPAHVLVSLSSSVVDLLPDHPKEVHRQMDREPLEDLVFLQTPPQWLSSRRPLKLDFWMPVPLVHGSHFHFRCVSSS